MAKKTTKKITKVTAPIVIDFSMCADVHDVYSLIAEKKIEKYVSKNEAEAFLNDIIPTFKVYVCKGKCPFCHEEKKPNIFKRFWNWITRKK